MKPNRLLLSLLTAGLTWAPTAARAQTAATKPADSTTPTSTLTPAMKLEPVEVLGSRIRRLEGEGPSPVVTYDRDYIEATGAMTLADFMNYLPQNYTGIGAGRGSAPNELNPEFGQRTESTTPFTSLLTGAADAPPGQTGVSGVSVRGLGSGSTLVLVDGRRMIQSGVGNKSSDSQQGFVDLNGIPLGMIERIELITDGASAIYGADAVAGVVNIVLKKNWAGSELSGSTKIAQHGGGLERTTNFTTGFVSGKLTGSIGVDYYSRNSIKASQRTFSKNQDHRGIVAGYLVATGAPVAGRDLRLNWGYPGVVQARTGTLNGIKEAGGNDTRFAVINPGTGANPTLASFSAVGPSSLGSASTIVRGNTAGFLDLTPPSERYGLSGNFSYKLENNMEFYGRATFGDVRGKFSTQPGLSTASATSGFGNFGTIVPAAYNPFGQDVLVGMIHYEFGSTWQTTHSRTLRGLLGLRGQAFETWHWDVGASWQRYSMFQLTRLFNGAAVTAALANPDPALRLNPFIDARTAGVTQAAIYELMARYNTVDSNSSERSFDFTADGDVYTLPGGPLKMAFGASYDNSANENRALSNSEAVVPVVTRTSVEGERSSESVYAELSVPIFGKPNALPLIRRLEAQLAGRYENHSPYSKSVPKYGVSWVPVQSLLLRSSYSEGFRAPSLTEYQVATSTSTTTVTDPRRTPASTPNVQFTKGSAPNVGPETSKNEFYGIVFDPPFVKGLDLQVNYYRTEQKNTVQILTAQTIVNNEAVFATRIQRDPATASDLALNQPGQITKIDGTFVNFGKVVNESLDIGADYMLPWEQLGRWRFGFNASRTLKATRQLAPGQPAVILEDDTAAPPKWKMLGSIFWSRGQVSASLFANYLSGFKSNSAGNSFVINNTTVTYVSTPSVMSFDVRGGYTFKQGVWRGYGKGLRLNVGVGNVFDEKPPFSDTVFGYNGGLHGFLVMGRNYELSFRAPF